MRLRDLGEGEFLRRIRRRFQNPGTALGIGDDTAVFEMPSGCSALFCSDLVAENTHFIRDLHPPDAVGFKAVAVNVSDIGAMGGTPLHFTVSLAAPGDLEMAWIDGFYDGVEKACREFGASLVGGDSSSAASIFVDVAMIGTVRTGAAVKRSGARAGDSVYVTGTLGGSLHGLAMLRSGDRESAAVKRHLYPQPRHRVGAALAADAHAMIDVSDGLSTDLAHIAEESGVSIRIHKDKLPAANGASDADVLHGGEEYELIIVAQDLPAAVEGVPLTRIGEIVPSAAGNLVLLDGSVLRPQGWQHFSG
jgi:thiamine-monophosphate kinase